MQVYTFLYDGGSNPGSRRTVAFTYGEDNTLADTKLGYDIDKCESRRFAISKMKHQVSWKTRHIDPTNFLDEGTLDIVLGSYTDAGWKVHEMDDGKYLTWDEDEVPFVHPHEVPVALDLLQELLGVIEKYAIVMRDTPTRK